MDKIVSFSNWLKVVKTKNQPTTSMYASQTNNNNHEPPKKRQKVSHHHPLFVVDGAVEQTPTQDKEQNICVSEGEVVEMMGIDDYDFGAPLKRVPTPYPKKNKDQYDDDKDDEDEREQ
ncbi:hypothetical protein CBS147321_7576 [Aspergillus niger]|nr:hypothetical protein CBS133816_3395 [Aspergillus niger]KAI2937902.1 hypothetical protein CBS147321_7576 [Aspergillus niger]KAI2953131.1 hypothetical protein CBS147322_4295 [Aspergillus niger]KAI3044745.1 hypothetical protein CBS147352_8044 [Aspergillus niger]